VNFDYVREIYGVMAKLTDDSEFFALLLVLRSTGQRALLLVFDPHGMLVHQELIQRRSPRTALWAAGQPGHQEISVIAGEPTHYSVPPR